MILLKAMGSALAVFALVALLLGIIVGSVALLGKLGIAILLMIVLFGILTAMFYDIYKMGSGK